MKMRRLIRFIATYAVIGIAAAVGIAYFFPNTFRDQRPVVELHENTANSTAVAGPESYAGAVKVAAPSVVNVYTLKKIEQRRNPLFDDPFFRRFFGERGQNTPRERTETSLGSGVIVSDDGYVLTNNHVVDGADEIQVLLQDGRSARATVVGTDPDTDIAVLKVELSQLPTITIGDSDGLQVGDVVLAIGNPFGVGQTVTQGIVSATGRSHLGLSTFENFIQTDAAINPGNSGGALIDTRGQLIGINTAIYSRSGGSLGIGFAIPARLARTVMQSLIENGRVIRGWIGVEVQGLTPELAKSFGLDEPKGVVVTGVLQGGPAGQAGLKPGDVIQEIDGKPVTGVKDLLYLITERKPGATLDIRGARMGKAQDWSVKVQERPRQSNRES